MQKMNIKKEPHNHRWPLSINSSLYYNAWQFISAIFYRFFLSPRTVNGYLRHFYSAIIIPVCMIQELLKLHIDFFKRAHKQTMVISIWTIESYQLVWKVWGIANDAYWPHWSLQLSSAIHECIKSQFHVSCKSSFELTFYFFFDNFTISRKGVLLMQVCDFLN